MFLPSPKIAFILLVLLALSGCASINTEDSDAPSQQTSVQGDTPVVSVKPDEVDTTAVQAEDLTQKPSIRKILPELQFPDIDFSSLPVSEPGSSMAITDTGINNSLWNRLRRGFAVKDDKDLAQRIQKLEKWYAKHPKYFDRLADRAYWFLPYILEQVEARGLPTEVAILPAIESAFRPDATSKSKAAGMWQFIGATGRRFGLRQDWWMDGRRDLVQSTRAALDYLEYLSQEFNGDWELAFAAYNAGEGGVNRRIKKNRKKNLSTRYAHLDLPKETKDYVPRLLAVRNILAQPEKFGIALRPLKNRPSLAVIDLKSQTDISVAASFIDLSHKQLHFLNLGYKRGVTPPNGPHTLVVPIKDADFMLQKISKLNPTQRMQWAHHKVRKGEYLGKIANAHGVTVKSIQLANGLKSNLIKPGQELRIPLSTGSVRFAGPTGINLSADRKKHLVTSGDSLWKISRLYNKSLGELMSWNNLTKKTTLYPGQQIIVNP